MPTTQSRLATHAPQEPRLKQGAPLTKTAKPRTKAQERANKKLLEDRQAWDIEKIIVEQEAVASKRKVSDEGPRWDTLLVALDKHAAGSWALLDKALSPFCMGATGPMNPKTGQYVTEIRMVRNQVEQVEQVLEGIETVLPFLTPQRGSYEFRIKLQGAKIRDKNWLNLSKDGKAQVLSSVHPAVSFHDLRSALAFICENRPAAEKLQ
ncbi:hypothetical protein ACFQAT_13805 [Undibacterium arcticum]|uniref:Uncharacterized protein n=1 Tax=Undibacterium arcticum TaxID=1762892 RepID=A0ABV7F000_9BURK